MKVNKNSWHYKLWQNFGTDGSKTRNIHTTCSYVRGVAFAFVIAGMLLSMLTFLFCSVVTFPVGLFLGIEHLTDDAKGVIPMLMTVGMCVWFTTSITFLFAGITFATKSWREARKEKAFVKLMAKAKEDKQSGICTIVEFE